MIIEEKVIKIPKLEVSERNALEILSTVNCDGVNCDDCPLCGDTVDSCLAKLSRRALGYDCY